MAEGNLFSGLLQPLGSDNREAMWGGGGGGTQNPAVAGNYGGGQVQVDTGDSSAA